MFFAKLSRARAPLLAIVFLLVLGFIGGKEMFSAQVLSRKVDLTVSQNGPETVRPGETVSYALGVKNVSGEGAGSVIFGDVIPPGLTFVPGQSDASCAAVEEGIIFCGGPVGEGFTLGAGEERVFNVAFAVPSSAGCKIVIQNRIFAESFRTTDPKPEDNVSTITTGVACASHTASPSN